MKWLTLLIGMVIFLPDTFSQVPESMSYQAVLRDEFNHLVTNQNVGMQISILQGSADGAVVYVERQFPGSNLNGLVTIEIGTGILIFGNFSSINWGNGPYFIKTETDLKGGSNYSITGTSQMLTVPYAFYANKAKALDDKYEESDPIFSAWDRRTGIILAFNQITDVPSFLTEENDSSVTNEIQMLTLSNDTIFLSKGGFVILPGSFSGSFNDLEDVPVDLDTDSTNDFSGNYIDLKNIPKPWDSSYSSIKNLPNFNIYATKDMAGNRITNLGNPLNAKDAVTKEYVDALLDKIDELEALNTRLKDADGNLYSTVKIGNQLWMAENLRTTKYSDNNPIPEFRSVGSISPAYEWYRYDKEEFKYPYGAYYNDLAINTNKLCPSGWRVPSQQDWQTLINYLGGSDIAGGKLKDTGTRYWLAPNTGASNESGFTALGGGVLEILTGFS